MSELRIRQLLETRALAWAAALETPLEVSVENVSFTPTDGVTYIETTLLPADSATEFFDGTHTRYTGVFQISILAPLNDGAGPSGLLAKSLRDTFACFSRIAGDDGFTVIQTSPLSVGPGITDELRYIVPTSFTYRADTTA